MNLFEQDAYDRHAAVHCFSDEGSGLRAIVAIHSTALGPALGGCRRWSYRSEAAALTDALRLSRGMSFKNAVAGLPFGGGKAVILGDGRRRATPAQLQAFGRMVESLGGSYITAEDVGITVEDMEQVALRTGYVSGLPDRGGDPSPQTAHGVFEGIRACARQMWQRGDLQGLTVAVQGLGGVGYHLCAELHAAGARLLVADLDDTRLARAQEAFSARCVPADEILFQPVDVLAPCALGGVLHASSIPHLQARVVAGAANNLLGVDDDGERLRRRGILYAPDYVINAGGVISVAAGYRGEWPETEVARRIESIGETLSGIFEEASARGISTHRVADEMAAARLALRSPLQAAPRGSVAGIVA